MHMHTQAHTHVTRHTSHVTWPRAKTGLKDLVISRHGRRARGRQESDAGETSRAKYQGRHGPRTPRGSPAAQVLKKSRYHGKFHRAFIGSMGVLPIFEEPPAQGAGGARESTRMQHAAADSSNSAVAKPPRGSFS